MRSGNCFKKGSKSKGRTLRRKRDTIPYSSTKAKEPPHPVATADKSGPINNSSPSPSPPHTVYLDLEPRNNDAFEWTEGHRLSTVLELLEFGCRRDTLHSSFLGSEGREFLERKSKASVRQRLPALNREEERLRNLHYDMEQLRASQGKVPRPIAMPSKDLAEISQIDKSLVFQHFTATDAWDLGSALRARLMPIPTPVVINISLANQNQTLFHACTHSGVVPDNDSWVARKRKTVLRWGFSTWYMHCKFDGDEKAFAAKYGLGSEAGSYAIHGGGVPIRVVGVEGVVAVVVVSGLKQYEDHGVVVEVIKELYY